MARFSQTVPTRKSAAELAPALGAYLQAQGFSPLPPDDQGVWKKGGQFSNPLFVRCAIKQGTLELEAWVRFLVFPGVHIGEYDLEGFFLMMQKKELKSHVAKLEALAK